MDFDNLKALQRLINSTQFSKLLVRTPKISMGPFDLSQQMRKLRARPRYPTVGCTMVDMGGEYIITTSAAGLEPDEVSVSYKQEQQGGELESDVIDLGVASVLRYNLVEKGVFAAALPAPRDVDLSEIEAGISEGKLVIRLPKTIRERGHVGQDTIYILLNTLPGDTNTGGRD